MLVVKFQMVPVITNPKFLHFVINQMLIFLLHHNYDDVHIYVGVYLKICMHAYV